MAAAAKAGLHGQRPAAVVRTVRGTVKGIVGSRGLVQLDDGQMATVWEELTLPGVGLDRLLRAGQMITGAFDTQTRRLDLSASLARIDGSRELPLEYRDGTVVLAEVVEVSDDVLTVRLVPGVEAAIPRSAVTTNELDHLSDLFSQSDVVAAHLSRHDGVVGLSLFDVDDGEEPLAAPALLAGGPPWLVLPPLPTVIQVQDVAAPAVIDEPPTPVVEPAPAPAPPAVPHRPSPRDLAAAMRRSAAPGDSADQAPVGRTPLVNDLTLRLEAAKTEIRRL
ncbi:MAG TPA: S1 RNA-binding domain-containing protein, partial [Candidatus Limnocylindrales bacterium]